MKIGAGRVRELTGSSLSKFKMVWYQLSTVPVPGHQLGKFVQFILGHGGQMPLFSIQVQFIHLFHELFRPWLGLTWLAQFGSASFQSFESPVVWEEQF